MTLDFLTLDDLNLEGRTVIARLDLNSPIDPESGEIMDDTRIRSHIPTLRELRDSKVVILAHQSRPGKKDYTPLRQHAITLQKHLERPVEYIDTLFDSRAVEKIRSLEAGDVLLLENVRFYAEEVAVKGDMQKLSKCRFVRTLADVADIFVNDAFAAAHRAHPSLIGFIQLLPSAAGRLMEKELKVLRFALKHAQRPSIALLGGAKVDDSVAIMENMLSKDIVDKVLTCGVVGNIMLLASGYRLGTPSEEYIRKHLDDWEQLVERARSLLSRYGDRIEMPSDVAISVDGVRKGLRVDRLPQEHPIYDMGLDTVVHYSRVIEGAKTVFVNGPAGVFELPEFAFGTEELFLAIARSKAFSVAGGGETSAVIQKMGIASDINHLSTGGGACITLLSGQKLPVEEALREAKRMYIEGYYNK
jgi:phosphoglycerate kinase